MKNLYILLIEELSQHFPIPNEGIIAGQSVAEAYFRVHEIDIVSRYKDLDLFVDSDAEHQYGLARGNETTLSLKYISGHGEVVDTLDKGGYFIVDSKYNSDSKINTITVECQGELTGESILDGFDLNIVSIALDLSNKKVIISPSFKAFIKTKTLKLTTLHTPISSFIRAVDKASYITNVNIDIEHMAKQVSTSLSLRTEGSSHFDFFIQGTGISKGRFNLLSDNTKKTLAKYFTIESKSFDFSQDNKKGTDILNAMVFTPIKGLSISGIFVGGGTYPWVIAQFKNDIDIVNKLIERKFDTVMLQVITSLNYLERVNHDIFLPWFMVECIKGRCIHPQVFECISRQVYNDYIQAVWLKNDGNNEFFDLSVFESFAVIHSVLSRRGMLHLMRELNWCVESGITDVTTITKALENVADYALKRPEVLQHQPKYKICLFGNKKEFVNNWSDLVKCFPFHNAYSLNDLWQRLIENELIISFDRGFTNSCDFENVELDVLSRRGLIQIKNGFAIINNPLIVMKQFLKDKTYNIRSKFFRMKFKFVKKTSTPNHNPSICFDDSIPF